MAKPDFEPAMERSVWQTGIGSWAIGSSMRCESFTDSRKPEDAIAAWKDADGVDYCLRPQDPPLEQSECGPGDKPFFFRHWSSVLFEVGRDILVKVKYSPPGWYSVEGDALNLIRSRTPEVPVPECIHFGIDRKWNRSFLIMPRIQGVTLDDIWWSLSQPEQEWVACELAEYQVTVARSITSDVFKGVNGDAYKSVYFTSRDIRIGVWDCDPGAIQGPLTPEQLREQMSELSGGEEIPDLGTVFHLFHNDLGPENVLISVGEHDSEGEREVHVAAIIDWDRAAFVPDWWLTLYPTVRNGAYWLSLSKEQEDTNLDLAWDYVRVLNAAMRGCGWECGYTHMAWSNTYFDGQSREEERRFNEAKLAGCVKWLSDTA